MKKLNYSIIVTLFISIILYSGCNKEVTNQKQAVTKMESFTKLLPSDAREMYVQTADLDYNRDEEKIVVYYGQHSEAKAFILSKNKLDWQKVEITNPKHQILGEFLPIIFEIYDYNRDEKEEIIFNWGEPGEFSTTYVYQFINGKVKNLLCLENTDYPSNAPILKDIDNDGKVEIFNYIGNEDLDGKVKGIKKTFTWSNKKGTFVLSDSKPYSFVRKKDY